MMKPLQLIVGLGNPGKEHENNRHNAGYWFVDALARDLNARFSSEGRVGADVCKLDGGCRLAKPHSYMNESGLNTRALLDYYKLEAPRLLVAHDDMDMPVGIVRLKDGGGCGGHNGLLSLRRHLGDPGFKRLRIGIGRPPLKGSDVTPWVLGNPNAAQREAINDSINRVLSHISHLLEGEFPKAMSLINRAETN
ncbi:MAG: aminoacyl-tRNA hydrolase [Candidatus Eutrophobiaceae bacterium]